MKIVHRGFIYESTILEAYTVNDIKQKYGNIVKDFLTKSSPDLDATDQDVNSFITEIYNVDPSSDKKYLGAITQWVLSKRPEDLETQIKDYLHKFKKLLDLNPGKFGNVSKEISKGKYTLDQLKNLVNANSELLGKNKNMLRIEDKVGNFPLVGENEKYVCYMVDKWVGEDQRKNVEQIASGKGQEKHFCFSGDVDWCVKYKNYFDGYNPPYYYFLEKATGKEFALLHIPSLQIKDIRDSALKAEDFMKIKDIVIPILVKSEMPYDNLDYGDSDFSVILSNITSEEFKQIFKNNVGKLVLNAIEMTDLVMLDKLFNSYPASELMQQCEEVSHKSQIEQSVKWLVKNMSIYQLSDIALKGLLDEFYADEEILFVDTVRTTTSHNVASAYNRRNEIAKWMIDEEYVLPNWDITMYGMTLTVFEWAVFSKNLGAVEASLANQSTDLNTKGLDGDHRHDGVTPLYYIANLSNYETDHIFNLLVNDPRVDVNAFREEYDSSTGEYTGRSVLDNAIESRVDILKSKGAKHYDELPNTLKAKDRGNS